MVGLLLVFGLIFVAITVFLWAGTLFLQSYLYSEPAAQLYWRAPLTAAVLTLFLALWSYLAYRSPGRYGTFFDISTTQSVTYKKLWGVKRGQEIPFMARANARGVAEFRDERGRAWSRSDSDGIMEAILVEDEDGQKARFEPELTKDGRFAAKSGESVAYREVGGRGRVMTDESPGMVETQDWSKFLGNFFLNSFFLILWFVTLWLLLQYQWGHAFGLAVVLWLVVIFTVVPLLVQKSQDLARPTPRSPGATVRQDKGWVNVSPHVDARMCMMSPSCTT